ncbi:hypothetical protein [Undibacterium aquatile]|jgi:hypothetical protein|nr:hypothetical protein [Undibacterium aquatile]
MSIHYEMHSELSTPPSKASTPEILVSAVLHLMSHYTVNSINAEGEAACVKLASVIEKHLQALSELPELAPVLRATCQQLSEQWATLVDRNLCQPRKPKRFSWLM